MKIALISCKFKYPWMIIIFLQISVLFIAVSSYLNTNWAGNEKYSVGVLIIKHRDSYYNVVKDLSTYCHSGENPQLCQMMKNLWSGFLLYSASLGFYCVFMVLWIISSVSFLVNKNYFALGWISGILCGFSLGIGLVLWIYANEISIFGSQKNSGDLVNNNLRLRPGFYNNLLIFVLISFIQLYFIIIGKLVLKLSKLGYEGITQAEENLSRFHRHQDTKAISINIDFE